MTNINKYPDEGILSNPEELYGRKEEIENIYERIKTVQSTFIVGERGIGKSALLYYLYINKNKYLESPDRYIYLFIDIKKELISSPDAFFNVLLRELRTKTKDKISISEDISFENVRNTVFRSEKSGYQLIIFIDEFDLIANNNKFDGTFYSNLRSLAPYKVAYIINSIKKIVETGDIITSPFFNIFIEIQLLPLNREDAIALIDGFSKNRGISLRDNQDFIFDVAGYNPYLILIACSNLVNYKSKKKELNESDYDQIREGIWIDSKSRFEYIWKNISKDERDVIFRLASSKPINERSEHNLRDLETKGYVIKKEHNSFFRKTITNDIFSSLFKKYIIEMGDKYA